MADCRGFWKIILEWWEVKWRPFVDFADFFSFCNNVSYKGVVKSLWLISVSAACWSVWLARNELVFDRRWPKMSSLVFLSKIRALMWIKPVYDELKVNEKFEGVVRAVFSGPSAATESSATEVGAVCLALEVFQEMGWMGSCSLTIEVGSSEVFCWIENKGSRPWSLVSFFKGIESRVSSIGNVYFSKVDKQGNVMAFALAAAGIKRQSMFKAWW
ncbi:hypothetical protein J1N35_028485 [Gossypium stocksii]|uniref:RNase H type-1 domain-containing protein n=1 Tax=Gossypium stocksii TaxID=47602 RepID=A0A9D3UW92_9ROSI|nr:hypothetical protein J1N35_028485 [Gossypium stocksii]